MVCQIVRKWSKQLPRQLIHDYVESLPDKYDTLLMSKISSRLVETIDFHRSTLMMILKSYS